MVRLIFLLSLMSLFTACSVDITGLNIDKVELDATTELQTNGLGPGESKNVTFLVDAKRDDGTVYNIPNAAAESFEVITSPGLTYKSIDHGPVGTLSASFSNLSYWRTGLSMTYKVKNNSYPEKTILIPANLDRLQNMIQTLGQNIIVYTTRISNTEGWPMRLFKIVVSGNQTPYYLIIKDFAPFSITSKGRRGEDGRDGQSSNKDGEYECTTTPTSGDDGQNGGNVDVYSASDDVLLGLTFTSEGGKGGEGGSRPYGCSGKGFSSDGSSGREGVISYNQLSVDELRQQFSDQDLTGLSW